MRWIKKGLIFTPPQQKSWSASYTAVPMAEHIIGDRWRIFFSSRDACNRSHVGFFDVDIRTPDRPLVVSERPVLSPGGLGTFDEAGAMGSWMVSVEGKTYLYYTGWNVGVSVPFRNAIGLAISEAGLYTFTKYSDGPILDRSIYDPCFISNPCVLVENGTWRMWYLSGLLWKQCDGQPQPRYHIKYAESGDGIHWRRDGHVCIDFRDDTETAISRPCVVKDQTGYKMWYSYRGSSYRIGYAESTDGLQWKRKDEEAGIDVSPVGWDSEMIEYAFVFDHNGNRYVLYNGNSYGKTGIGLAVLAPP
jgi:predicted GH43/DUF377 family glycosyl hydrolase